MMDPVGGMRSIRSCDIVLTLEGMRISGLPRIVAGFEGGGAERAQKNGEKFCYLYRSNRAKCTVTPLSLRVLQLFGELGEERLDLHVLFEAAGNDPEERLRVLDAIEELVRAGMLEACSGDFYALTEKGKGQTLRLE